ncbi:MAG: ATP-binding cassette domain-containing protein, partial [Rhodothermaceae bacterium TMED105]
QGLETRLGNNGINLSGGQKQRISIARELYKDIDFLFLDEATSALDSETEQAIQQNIEALKGQITIVMIAHRLSTVKHADKVIVLKKGRIEAEGSYQELQQSSEIFKRMVEMQEL